MPLNDITPLLEKARAQALARQVPVLVSATRLVPPVDPLVALENARRLSASDKDIARDVTAGCFYWTRPADAFAFSGVGAAVTLEPSGPDRFRSAQTAWASLLGNAIIDDAGELGPGPLLAGGFAFREAGPRTPVWNGFPAAHLTVPRVLVGTDGDRTWMTTTVLVGADGLPDADPETLEAVEEVMLRPGFSNALPQPGESATLEYHEAAPRSSWEKVVELAVGQIRNGDLEKVVLARALHVSAPRPIDVVSILHHLRDVHRESFVFACWRGDNAFVGASPERLVRLEGRSVLASSLAGTVRRGSTPEEDSANALKLLTSSKDQAEHAAVRSALASVLEEFCDDVEAPADPALLTLPHVHHLHTIFRAQLKDGASLLGLTGRLHPTPAVGGTPRPEAIAFIEKNEKLDRGWYASPIGWVGRGGGEFAVALRSALVSGHEATLFAGCGIVAGSDPALEYDESSLKMRSMQSAIGVALVAPDDAVAPDGAQQHITV